VFERSAQGKAAAAEQHYAANYNNAFFACMELKRYTVR
jgi:hypothetical protein